MSENQNTQSVPSTENTTNVQAQCYQNDQSAAPASVINNQQQQPDYTLSNQPLLDACGEYMAYLQLNDIRDASLRKIENSTEEVLTRLDEFGAQLDYIKSSSASLSTRVLPQLYLVSTNVEKLFRKVDCVQQHIQHVAYHVNNLEAKVAEMEKQQSQETMDQMKKKLIPKFLLGRSSSSASSPTSSPTQPAIAFNKNDYKIRTDILVQRMNEA